MRDSRQTALIFVYPGPREPEEKSSWADLSLKASIPLPRTGSDGPRSTPSMPRRFTFDAHYLKYVTSIHGHTDATPRVVEVGPDYFPRLPEGH